MFRKSALVLAIVGAAATGNAVALGLGDIDLKSVLNQPFNAEVELLSATEDDISELKVLLGSRQAFTNAGIDRSVFLSKLKFTVTQNSSNKPVVRITSRNPVTEPFLDFLLEVTWSKGKLLREYTVLVDPPVTMPAAPVALTAPTARPVTPVVQQPAVQPAKPVVKAPVQQKVTAPPPAKRVQNTALPPVSKEAGDYGPTRRSETLWAIAERVRPDTDVSMEQTMLGLLRANPEAFVNSNINNLKTGHVLRVPERSDLTSISEAAAKREASAQYAAWRQARADSKTAKQSANSSKTANAGTAAESKLQLVAADLDEANAGTVDQSGEQGAVNSLKRDLVLANEALEAQRSEGKEMTNRLSVLEEQIQNMQRLIQLKDDELARMQANAGSEITPADSEIAPNGDSDLGPAIASDLEVGLDATENVPSVEADALNIPGDEAEIDVAATEPAVEPISFLKTFTDSLMQNPLWLGLGAALLALLAFFGLRGRRSSDTEFQESILQSSSRIADEHLTDFSETQVRSADLHDSSLSEFAVSDMADTVDNNEANPMAEADVYLAYGRFQQAEELLKEALSNDPDNEELNLKLLGVHEAAGNTDAFDNHARDILTHLGDHEHPMWKKVAAMGLALSPNNPIYNPGGPTADVTESPGVEDLPSIDSLDQDVPVSVADNTVDFNKDISDNTNVNADGKLTDLDEISTKLDLARAYIDMGDPEGARNILSEVIEEGNDDQKNEANGILEKLAS